MPQVALSRWTIRHAFAHLVGLHLAAKWMTAAVPTEAVAAVMAAVAAVMAACAMRRRQVLALAVVPAVEAVAAASQACRLLEAKARERAQMNARRRSLGPAKGDAGLHTKREYAGEILVTYRVAASCTT